MKIAIISDSHDNVPNLEKALAIIKNQGVGLIIHCGDLCAPSMLSKVIAPDFQGEIHIVHGNVGDPDLLEEIAKKFSNVTVHGKNGEIEVASSGLKNKKIAFTHFPEEGKKLAESKKYDFVFYGHTHKPWEETLRLAQGKKCRLVNPGTLAGMFYKATFAIYDTETDELELKILELL
ncbi:MAG: metallophosphoesterase family protein [Patescibacteria group bacterium]|nr:metallophosphoesterase family protein [Patescibacteria group bacterium]